jgi:hypothetical protein
VVKPFLRPQNARRDDDTAGSEDRPVGERILNTVGEEQADALALLEAQASQGGRQAIGLAFELVILQGSTLKEDRSLGRVSLGRLVEQVIERDFRVGREAGLELVWPELVALDPGV